VGLTPTARCCSAVALIACSSIVAAAQSLRVSPLTKYDRSPVALLPAEPVWTLALNARAMADPAFGDGRAYFALEADRVTAYDVVSGDRAWVAAVKVPTALVAGDDRLFVVNADGVDALQGADGTPLWHASLPEAVVERATWSPGRLVVGTSEGSIVALATSDGAELWRRDLASPIHAAPAVSPDRVYLSTASGRVVALDGATGAPIWERRLGGSPNDLLVRGDRLFVGATDRIFYCLMTKDGRIDWRWSTGGNIVGMPAADDGHIYFVSLDNVLRAMHPVSGAQLWFRPLPFRPAWGPVRAGATVAVAGLTASIRTYAVKDGAAGAEIPAGGEVAAPLQVLTDPASQLPMLAVLTRDIASGATAKLVARSVEPALSPVSPLPNLITLAPALPRQP
jgi:outer membrane protein assembly factor BamB